MKTHTLLLLGLAANFSAGVQSPPLEAEPSPGGDSFDDQMIYLKSDPMPTIEGVNVAKFGQLLLESLEFPEPLFDRDTMIRMVVSMVVECDGSLSSIEFPYCPDKRIEAEVRRVTADSPTWTPGQIEGRPVRVKCVLPLAMYLKREPEPLQEYVYATPFEPTESPEVEIVEIAVENPDEDPDAAFTSPEKMPAFKGGDLNTFRNWVMQRLKYPDEALQSGISGRVIVAFDVEADGSVHGAEILLSPSPLFSAEVLRIIARCPRWTPGEQDGKPVKVRYTLPLDFRL